MCIRDSHKLVIFITSKTKIIVGQHRSNQIGDYQTHRCRSGAKTSRLKYDTRRPWQLVDGKLKKQFEFGSFILAFAFMTKVAMLAETLNHHPEWSNVYGRVVIELITHEINAISEKDFILAARIEAMAV